MKKLNYHALFSEINDGDTVRFDCEEWKPKELKFIERDGTSLSFKKRKDRRRYSWGMAYDKTFIIN